MSLDVKKLTTAKRIWLIFIVTEAILILGSALLPVNDIDLSLVLKFFALETGFCSFFLFSIMFLFTGEKPRVDRYSPIIKWVVILGVIFQIWMLLSHKH